MKLNTKAFAITCGSLWGLSVFVIVWWLIIFEGQGSDPTTLARFYRGLSITPSGSVIGLVYGTLDGTFGGFIFAWVYNKLADKFS